MKKLALSCVIAMGLGTAQVAQAQAALVNLVGAGLGLGFRAAKGDFKKAPKATAATEQPVAAATAPSSAPTELVKQRTPADKLPKKAAEQVTALEAQLEQCHAAMLASPTGPVCSPAQRTALQQAAMSVARAQPTWNQQPYQQEMAFYLAEDARRQQAAAPAAPAH
jgi:hypothetical protein